MGQDANSRAKRDGIRDVTGSKYMIPEREARINAKAGHKSSVE